MTLSLEWNKITQSGHDQATATKLNSVPNAVTDFKFPKAFVFLQQPRFVMAKA